MKRTLFSVVLILASSLSVACATTSAKGHLPALVILDTDIGGDYDDVGAVGMLHGLANNGEAEILATLTSNMSPLVVPGLDMINRWYGRGDIPIGALKEGVSQDSRELLWPDSLMCIYPHRYASTAEAPDALPVFRRALAEAPDNSVTLITIGFLTNLRDLLLSEPDDISPLDGRELAARKIKVVVAMAGRFPEGLENNLKRDAASSRYVAQHWPTEIIFSGFEVGNKVLTGLRLIKDGPKDSPVRLAYAISLPKRKMDRNGRMSWDQTAVLVGVRGVEPYYSTVRGEIIVDDEGYNTWRDDPQGRHYYLVQKADPASVAHEIETLMMADRTRPGTGR